MFYAAPLDWTLSPLLRAGGPSAAKRVTGEMKKKKEGITWLHFFSPTLETHDDVSTGRPFLVQWRESYSAVHAQRHINTHRNLLENLIYYLAETLIKSTQQRAADCKECRGTWFKNEAV